MIEESPESFEQAMFKFPLTDETKKKIEQIQKSPEFKCLVFDRIITELKKDPQSEQEKVSSLNKAQALANLI